MVVSQQDFPRGGVVKKAESKSKTQKLKSESLFKDTEGRRKKKIKKEDKKDVSDEENDYAEEEETGKKKKKKDLGVFDQKMAAAETLSYKLMAADMKVLGQVMAVHDLDLVISLPGRIVGTVPVINVSTPYTEGLKKIADSADDADVALRSLKDMFSVGQTVVANVSQPAADHTLKVILSLNPKDVNTNIPSSHVVRRKVFFGAVQSIEDHGYVIDLGINNARAFLKKIDTPLGEDEQYGVGQLVEVGVKKAVHSDNITNANLTANQKKIAKWKLLTLDEDSDFNVDTLLPGTVVDAVVEKVIPEGIKLSFYNQEGYVHKDNFPSLFGDQSKFSAGDIVQATVLYTLPLVKRMYLSLATYNVPSEDVLKIGDIVENARVMWASSAGIFVRLNKECRGFVPARHLADKKDTAVEIKNAHPAGANRKCRVLQYAPMDRTYICTMQKTLMKQAVLRLEDLEVGQIVECEVKELKSHGVIVTLGKNLEAYIPRLHWADDPRLKKPEARFLPGAKLKCKVLRVDPVKHKVHLTNKKSLFRSDLPILSRFDDAKVGVEVEGTAVLVNKEGVLVAFYGDVRGFLPNVQIVEGKIEHPEKLFYLGQVIRCHIMSIFHDEKKMALSMIQDTDQSSKKTHEDTKGNVSEDISITPTKIYTCTVQSVGMKGVNITVDGGDGVIPIGHLSDFGSLNDPIFRTVEPGDELEAVCLSTGKLRLFSLKESLLKVARSGNFPKTLSDLQVDMVMPLVVFSQKPYGVFCKSVGLEKDVLVPKKDLPPGVVGTGPEDWDLPKYTSLIGRINKVDLEKREVSATTTISALRPSLQDSIATLEAYLISYGRVVEHYEEQKTVELGQQLSATVMATYSDSIELRTSNGLPLVCQLSDPISEPLDIGSTQDVFVVWHGFGTDKVYVSDNSQIAALVQSLSDSSETLKIGSEYSAVIIHTENNFSVACTTQVPYCLIYLPQKLGINDFGEKKDMYKVGYVYNIVIKEKLEDFVIGITVSQRNEKRLIPRKVWCRKFGETERKRKTSETKETTAPESKRLKEEKTKPEKIIKKKQKVADFEDDFAVEEKKVPALSVGDFSWDMKPMALPVGGASREEMSDSGLESEDETTEKPAKAPRIDRAQVAREEEKRLTDIEKSLMDPDRLPQSTDDFDRLLVSSPNSSIIWLKYMAYHLEQTEIEKARSVARRALKAINFREENEKLNIWMALLNLENLYGTPETVKGVFNEAIVRNDSLKVHQQTALMFATSGKTEPAEELYQSMLRKFKTDKSVWISAGYYYMKSKQMDKARQLLDRSLKSVEKKNHIELISRFAQMEMKLGDFERGKTMYETLLVTYPKRTDIWSVYVDALTKANYIEEARKILERAVALQLPPKKMKFFFQKYTEFEQKHGDPEREEYVRQKAIEFVERTSGEPVES